MKRTLITAEAICIGSRSGNEETLGNLLDNRLETRGLNPELMHAGEYSTLSHHNVFSSGKKFGMPIYDPVVRGLISLTNNYKGDRLSAELHALIPDLTKIQVQRIMENAHSIPQ